eukprot:3157149-Rhodomonas_salina.3
MARYGPFLSARSSRTYASKVLGEQQPRCRPTRILCDVWLQWRCARACYPIQNERGSGTRRAATAV